MSKYIILIFIFLSACASVPINPLSNGITQPSKLSEVEVIVTVGFSETQSVCRSAILSKHPDLMLAACGLNGCVIPACTTTEARNGKVFACHVYLSRENDELRSNEYEHCRGYKGE